MIPFSALKENIDMIRWLAFSNTTSHFPVGQIVNNGTARALSVEEIAAYDAPYPDESYKVGPKVMPSRIFSELYRNHQVWQRFYANWQKPFLTVFSDSDPITRHGDKRFQKLIPGALNQDHKLLKGPRHFLQEDASRELVDCLLAF